METARKITIQIPSDLLDKAQKATQDGVTATVRQGLTLLAASYSYKKLRSLRGKIKFSINPKELRKDRP